MDPKTKKQKALEKLDEMYSGSEPLSREKVEIRKPVQKKIHEVTHSYVCPECESEYETKKETRECCDCASEDIAEIYKCDDCEDSYDTVEEAKNCTCDSEVSEVLSANLSRVGSDYSQTTGLGFGGIAQMVIAFIVLIIVMGIGAQILATIDASNTVVVSSPSQVMNDVAQGIGLYVINVLTIAILGAAGLIIVVFRRR